MDWGIQIDCTELATITDDRVQTWYRLNWQWANNESTCNNTKVSNVKWISTTILPVYSCCYYYRSFVSIEYPDWRLWRHDPWKSSTDTPIRSEYNYLMRDLFYKGMRRLRSRGIKRQTLVRRILHQTRGQGIFFRLFFWFFAHGGWEETKVHYGDLLRSETSLFFVDSLWSGDQYFWHLKECLA